MNIKFKTYTFRKKLFLKYEKASHKPGKIYAKQWSNEGLCIYNP